MRTSSGCSQRAAVSEQCSLHDICPGLTCCCAWQATQIPPLSNNLAGTFCCAMCPTERVVRWREVNQRHIDSDRSCFVQIAQTLRQTPSVRLVLLNAGVPRMPKAKTSPACTTPTAAKAIAAVRSHTSPACEESVPACILVGEHDQGGS